MKKIILLKEISGFKLNLKAMKTTSMNAILFIFLVIFGIFHVVYLLVAPTLLFFFGYCPKKPKQLWQIYKTSLKGEQDYPFEVRYSPEPDAYPFSDYQRLVWYWGKKPIALPFSLFGLLLMLFLFRNIVILFKYSFISFVGTHQPAFYSIAAAASAFFIGHLFFQNKEKLQKFDQSIGAKIMMGISKIFFINAAAYFGIFWAIVLNLFVNANVRVNQTELAKPEYLFLALGLSCLLYVIVILIVAKTRKQ